MRENTNWFDRHPMLSLQLRALWRRKGSSAIIIVVMAAMALTCSVLSGLISRQSAALEQTIQNTQIRCTVTDARGQSNDIGVLSFYLDMLTGIRHERGCFLDEYVKDVNCMAKQRLTLPADGELRRIYSFDSDLALQQVSGAVITLYDGWTEECLRGAEQICLITESLSGCVAEEGGVEWIVLQTEDGASSRFQVIGRVSGISGSVVYCPFYAPMEEGVSTSYLMDSCSFLIQDNAKLEESKLELYSYFSVPSPSVSAGTTVAGLLVQDETYLLSLSELESNLALLRLLLPLLLLLSAGVNLVFGYLMNRRRLKEFAVMRCMGQRPAALFRQTFFQHGLLTATGCVLGMALGAITAPVPQSALAPTALVLALGLAGSAGAAFRISRIDPITLMKVEE